MSENIDETAETTPIQPVEPAPEAAAFQAPVAETPVVEPAAQPYVAAAQAGYDPYVPPAPAVAPASDHVSIPKKALIIGGSVIGGLIVAAMIFSAGVAVGHKAGDFDRGFAVRQSAPGGEYGRGQMGVPNGGGQYGGQGQMAPGMPNGRGYHDFDQDDDSSQGQGYGRGYGRGPMGLPNQQQNQDATPQ